VKGVVSHDCATSKFLANNIQLKKKHEILYMHKVSKILFDNRIELPEGSGVKSQKWLGDGRQQW
jgi:hypothetical protein